MASNASVSSYNADTVDATSSHPDLKGPRLESVSSSGTYPVMSGFSSPASSMSGPSALRTGNSSTIALGSPSPRNVSPIAPSSQKMTMDGRRTQAGEDTHLSLEVYSKDTFNEHSLERLPTEGKELQHLLGHAPPLTQSSTGFSYSQIQARKARRTALVPTLLHHSTSDSSSKSSATSTWSNTSTACSSVPSLGISDESKTTSLSLPPPAALTNTSGRRALVSAELGALRQNVGPSESRGALLRKSQQTAQSASNSSSIGMKFESLQLPLPYNISFGQRPSSRPEHEPKLANIFDLQDIPGERRSLGNLTLQQERSTSPYSSTSPGVPEPQHPPHFPKLPSLDTSPRDDTQENALHPDADPLSVLAYAGRLVGRESKRPPS